MNDGGSAFPDPAGADPNIKEYHHGMRLRDWFAGQIMAGLMANPNVNLKQISDAPGGFSISIYAMAEAMLAERERQR